ncbi:g4099 [Coccomyxa viridis]|uniref:G4099 protein n=1 Tax=Coccomyxa viridis TaxID=1274662 RepID=A0ABP1FPF1_9CHLO
MAAAFQSLQSTQVPGNCREQPKFLATVESIHELPLLETLSLTCTEEFDSVSACSLDCHANTQLQHVRLENFVPTQYRFGAECKIHGAWSATRDYCDSDFFNWAGCGIWHDQAVASIEIYHADASLLPHGSIAAALAQVLSIGRNMDYISLHFQNTGSKGQPFSLLELPSTRSLRLIGTDGCHVTVERDVPLTWRTFGLSSHEEVSVDLRGDFDFLQDLEQFYISYGLFAGPTCALLAHAMGTLGRKVYTAGDRFKSCFSSSEVVEDEHWHLFDKIMPCECQACLSCLHRAGKLPEGSALPKAPDFHLVFPPLGEPL